MGEGGAGHLDMGITWTFGVQCVGVCIVGETSYLGYLGIRVTVSNKAFEQSADPITARKDDRVHEAFIIFHIRAVANH